MKVEKLQSEKLETLVDTIKELEAVRRVRVYNRIMNSKEITVIVIRLDSELALQFRKMIMRFMVRHSILIDKLELSYIDTSEIKRVPREPIISLTETKLGKICLHNSDQTLTDMFASRLTEFIVDEVKRIYEQDSFISDLAVARRMSKDIEKILNLNKPTNKNIIAPYSTAVDLSKALTECLKVLLNTSLDIKEPKQDLPGLEGDKLNNLGIDPERLNREPSSEDTVFDNTVSVKHLEV